MIKWFFFPLIFFVMRVEAANFFVGFELARWNLDYRSVAIGNEKLEMNGGIELAGFSGGLTDLTPGSFGYELGLEFLGTNSQKLNPEPNWGTPWYYKITGVVNYTFSFRLFFFLGPDIIGAFNREAESNYFGAGITYGLGYKINEQVSLSLGTTNNSILFSGGNGRYIRGEVLKVCYLF